MAGLAALGALATKAAGSKALGTAATTLGITGMNQLLQDRAFRREKKWWKEQFDYAAKYDTPSAQIKRMKEAGLNPALMYGGSGSIEGAPSPGGGAPGAAQAELSNLSLMSAQVENLKKDSDLKQATSDLQQSQAITEMSKGRLTSAQARVAEGLVQTNMDLQKLSLDLKQEELVGRKIDNYIKDQTKASQVKNLVYDAINKANQAKGQELKNIEQELLNTLLKRGVVPGGLVGDIMSIFRTVTDKLPAAKTIKEGAKRYPLKVTNQESFYKE